MFLQTACRRAVSARPSAMPLRAKILSPAMQQSAARSFASAADVKELPDDEPNDVLFANQGGVRAVTLNRPKKLNSLNGSMARKILPRLYEYSKSEMASVIVLKGEGRALCAGGDVAWLAQRCKEGTEGQQEAIDYFGLEYKLDHLIATYQKPYVAFMDGITMGGGVGLSLHAPFRIATENSVFAMPETTIGFFPDVGASFFLPRMDGELGTYCALTSEQIKGVNVFYAGIATHYIHSSSLPDLEARLAELRFKDYDDLQQRYKIINRTIEEFVTGLPHDQPISSPVGGNIRTAIDYVFQPANNIHQVLEALDGLAAMDTSKKGGDVIPEWATKTKKIILQRSPTSVQVTLRMIREGSTWSIAETFKREHGIAGRFVEHPDFVEGVTALLVDKPKRKPNWTPDTLEQVSKEDVDSFFTYKTDWATLGKEDGSTGVDYTTYPHAWIGLPREREVQNAVQKSNDWKTVVDDIVKQRDGKQGVKEKVEEILTRKTDEQDGRIQWKR